MTDRGPLRRQGDYRSTGERWVPDDGRGYPTIAGEVAKALGLIVGAAAILVVCFMVLVWVVFR